MRSFRALGAPLVSVLAWASVPCMCGSFQTAIGATWISSGAVSGGTDPALLLRSGGMALKANRQKSGPACASTHQGRDQLNEVVDGTHCKHWW